MAGQQSLLVVWHNGRLARGCVFRLDPAPEDAWSKREETCLADLAARWLGTPVSFVIGGYNEFLALPDPGSGVTYLTGMQAFLTDPGDSRKSMTALSPANPHLWPLTPLHWHHLAQVFPTTSISADTTPISLPRPILHGSIAARCIDCCALDHPTPTLKPRCFPPEWKASLQSGERALKRRIIFKPRAG